MCVLLRKILAKKNIGNLYYEPLPYMVYDRKEIRLESGSSPYVAKSTKIIAVQKYIYIKGFQLMILVHIATFSYSYNLIKLDSTLKFSSTSCKESSGSQLVWFLANYSIYTTQ